MLYQIVWIIYGYPDVHMNLGLPMKNRKRDKDSYLSGEFPRGGKATGLGGALTTQGETCKCVQL